MLPEFTLGHELVPRKNVYLPFKYRRTIRTVLKTDSLANYFRRVLNEKHFVATVYGPPGIGKSESMIELARNICPEFKLKEDLVFDLESLYDAMEKDVLKKWEVKILDDFGSELDPSDAMFDPAKHFSHHLQTARTMPRGYIITTPNKKYINKTTRDRLADYFIELKKKNTHLNCVSGVVHWIQQNNRTEKQYNHCLCISPDGIINHKEVGDKVWEFTFNPPPKEMHDEYIPLRIAKGERNMAAGRADYKKSENKRKDSSDVIDEIWPNIEKYLKRKDSGRVIINKSMIEVDTGIGGKKSLQVEGLIRRRLEEEGRL